MVEPIISTFLAAFREPLFTTHFPSFLGVPEILADAPLLRRGGVNSLTPVLFFAKVFRTVIMWLLWTISNTPTFGAGKEPMTKLGVVLIARPYRSRAKL
jgi:hypothetical protein